MPSPGGLFGTYQVRFPAHRLKSWLASNLILDFVPYTVGSHSTSTTSATVAAVFRPSMVSPGALPLWPRRPVPSERRPRGFDREFGQVGRERFIFEVGFDQRRARCTRGVADRDHEGVTVVVELDSSDFGTFFAFSAVHAD